MSRIILLALVALLSLALVAGSRHPNRRPSGRGHSARPWQLAEFMRNPSRRSSPARRFRFGLGVPFFEFNVNFGGRQNSWWEGPHVCETRTGDDPPTETQDAEDGEEEEIVHHNYARSESCDVTQSSYKCTSTVIQGGVKTTVTVVKECCLGYTRKVIDHGCPREQRLRSLADTARHLGLDEFLNAVQSVNLTAELDTGTFTVFAPTNDAFTDIGQALPESGGINLQDMGSVLMVSKPMMDQLTQNVADVLLGHMTTDAITTTSLQDEQLIETLSPYKSKIRINFYDVQTKVTTANCQRVTSSDNMATNGVIHVVEKVLSPVTRSILDVIAKDPNLSFLKTAVGQTGLGSILRDDGQYTLYAPTDAAFRKLDKALLTRLFSQPECLTHVIKNHLLPNVICSAAVQGRARTPNILDTYMHVRRDKDNKLFINDKQVVASDIMATNGVVHLIDDVLLTDQAMGVLDLAQKENASHVLDLIRSAGLWKTLANATDITFFAPTNEAFSNLDPTFVSALENDIDALRNLLSFHVTSGVHSTDSFYNNQRLDSLSLGTQVRINEYTRPFPRYYRDRQWTRTAQCASIVSSSAKGCNGVVHFVDKVLIRPRGNVIDVLELDSRFSRFVELLKSSGLADVVQGVGPYTVMAPTNEAFDHVSHELEDVIHDPEQLQVLLKSHIAEGAVCCVAIRPGGFFRNVHIRALSGDKLVLDSSRDGTKTIGGSTVTECDVSATNGVVHVMETVITQPVDDEQWGHFWGFPDWF